MRGGGLPNPVYFIAVASDGPIPDLPAGIFAPRQPPYVREISTLQTELDQRGQRVNELTGALQEALRREAILRGELDQRGQRVEELSAVVNAAGQHEAALCAERDQRGQRVEELAVALQEAVLREASFRGEFDQRGRRLDELARLLSDSRSDYERLRWRFVEADRQRIEAVRINEALFSSRSWRATSLLRTSSLWRRNARGRLYRAIAMTARDVYRALPLGIDFKMRVKDCVFRSMRPLFQRTGAYERWQAARRLKGVVAVGTTATMHGVLPPTELFAAAAFSTSETLSVADGEWEWRSYARTKARIAQILDARSGELEFRPRPIIEVRNESLANAAARIVLPVPSEAPQVTVIVPVYNELATTIECLLSLSRTSDEVTFEVIVANDGSTDETHEVLSRVPHLRLVSQAQNLGFLRNCNSASKAARGGRLVLLNNDAQVAPGWLKGLMQALDEPGVGAVGPRVVYPNGILQEAGVRIRREGTVEMIGLADSPEKPRWSYNRDVDYVSGACLMLETSLFHSLGGFNDDLAPAYCEDLELCLRIRERGLRIVSVADSEIVHYLSKSSDALGNAYKQGLIARNMQYLSQRHQATFDALDDLRVIAMYLPQFHPVPENDLWWGPGFTEWSNVAKARPNFVGHNQPRLPADLGYYDLRLSEVMEAQWKLADRYGIDGFCYYYYWFDGHRLLDRPLQRFLDIDTPAHPFCLCWANENWTRRWDGQDQEILIAQAHSVEDDLAVIRDLARYMRHPAYIRIGNKPLLLIYRVDLFPAFAETAIRWREECRRLGLGEIYLTMVESFRFAGTNVAPSVYGCDASVEFPAHYVPDVRPPHGALLNPDFRGHVGEYEDLVARFATREHPGFTRFRTVMPGWDNTARRQNEPFILDNPTPGAFQAWLETAMNETKRDLQGDERLVFINAWNEWAEGAYLEPDKRFGHAYLQAVRNARDSTHLLRDGES